MTLVKIWQRLPEELSEVSLPMSRVSCLESIQDDKRRTGERTHLSSYIIPRERFSQNALLVFTGCRDMFSILSYLQLNKVHFNSPPNYTQCI